MPIPSSSVWTYICWWYCLGSSTRACIWVLFDVQPRSRSRALDEPNKTNRLACCAERARAFCGFACDPFRLPSCSSPRCARRYSPTCSQTTKVTRGGACLLQARILPCRLRLQRSAGHTINAVLVNAFCARRFATPHANWYAGSPCCTP